MIYEKDVLMRLLTIFLEKLVEKISAKPISEITNSEMNTFYSMMFEEERESMIFLDIDFLLRKCYVNDVFSIEKNRALAELMYVECLRDINKDKELLRKTISLFYAYMQNVKTYDYEISHKISILAKIINEE